MRKLFTLAIFLMAALVLAGTPAMAQQCSGGVCQTCAGGDNDGGACTSDAQCPNGGVCDPGGPGQCAVAGQPANTFRVTADIATSTLWTADTEYILTKPIFVLDGATLSIEAGTVIRGEGESALGNNDPGTLIGARGSKIRMAGTRGAPIVMTDCEDDNLGGNPGTPPYDTAANAQSLEGRWGGLILLGYGYVGAGTAGAVDPTNTEFIEGLEATSNGLYGGCSDFLSAPFDRNCDDGDSGLINYVSLRYGGFNLAAANEINGLTLGGVGRDTEIDFIEVYQNQDDGIEWFGGAANVKHAVVVAVGDDTFDYDQGWRGKGQFWFAIQGEAGNEQGDKGGEWDGGDGPDASLPFSLPTIANMTQIGLGAAGVCLIGGETCFEDLDCPLPGDTCEQWAAQNDNTGLHIRDAAGGRVFNSFMGDFGGAVACIEGQPGAAGTPADNWDDPYTANGVEFVEFELGTNELDLDQNTFFCYEPGQALPDGSGTGAQFNCGGGDHFAPSDFYTKNDYLACGSTLPIEVLDRAPATLSNPGRVVEIDPRPTPGSPLLTSGVFSLPEDGFFEATSYRGAFAPEGNWANGWSTASRLGTVTFSECSGGVCRTCAGGDNDGGACTSDGDCPNGGVCDPGDVDFCEVDGDGDADPQPNGTFRVTSNISVSTTWAADTTYILTKPIFVENGATLTIEPGTVIRGEGESALGNNDPGALIAARGGVINAAGTEAAPIVFTDCSDDNVQGNTNPTAPYDTVQNARTLEGRWGGLILLGYGYVGAGTAGAVDPTNTEFIEGLEATSNGLYGGCDDFLSGPFGRNCDDGNSGTINYVSLRYGGFNLAAANEINGLTLGGVGRETDIDYIEVYQNQDDGIEWFGGAANVKHAIVIGVGDDSFDYDQGWRGNGQFWLQLQGEAGNEQSDKGGEWDGGDGPDASLPFALPTIANMTAVGLGGGGVCLIGGEACFIDTDCPIPGDTCEQWAAQNDNTGLHIRDAAGGQVLNSIMADFGGAVACIEGQPGSAGTPADNWDDSYNGGAGSGNTEIYLPQGIALNELDLRDNEFYCFGGGQNLPDGNGTGAQFNCGGGDHYFPPDFYTTRGNNYNACGDPLPFTTLDRDAPTLSNPGAVNSFDPRLAEEPTEATACPTIDAPSVGGFFESAPYKGAMSFGSNWGLCWSNAGALGLFPTCDETTGSGSEPNEVGDSLTFVSTTEFVWAGAACNTAGYDALRSSDASDFSSAQGVNPSECGDDDSSASDAQNPAAGSAFFYLVRGTNACGDGSLGQNNDTCGERTGPAGCL